MRFGSYVALDIVGQGGMGVVYRARHISTDELVAIKTVRVTNLGLLQSIRREVHALARMDHPGIIRILAEGVTDGLPWYAMELVGGASLHKHCDGLRAGLTPAQAAANADAPLLSHFGKTTWPRSQAETDANLAIESASDDAVVATSESKGPLPAFALRDTLTVMRRLCAPIAFLHGEGMVHRDLKPENILVREDGVPVIVDFGLATQFEGRLRLGTLQANGLTEGTLPYMAPEVLAGEIADARADLYALGCIFYGLLAGHVPFRGSVSEIIDGHLYRGAIPLREAAPDLPELLYDLVENLMAKQPHERIGYADDVAAMLGELAPMTFRPMSPDPSQSHISIVPVSPVASVRSRTCRRSPHSQPTEKAGSSCSVVKAASGKPVWCRNFSGGFRDPVVSC